MSILIEGGAVVTLDDEGSILDPGWLLIDDATIVEMGVGDAPNPIRRLASETIDASGSAVMPGMVNAHTHLFQSLFRGQADDKNLLDWLSDCIWPAASHFDKEIAYAAALVGLVENLRGGATSVIDHQYIHVDESIDEAVCRAADDLGIRFLLARGWADRNYHPPLMESADLVLERANTVWNRWDDGDEGLLRVELAPLIPWGCSDEAMRRTVAASRDRGRGTHIHCAETSEEVTMSLDERNLRHVEWLEELGVLGPDTQLAHSIWLDDGELDLIERRGSLVVHCPVSNMYLASGVPRIPEMLGRGIPIALASDGPGSNNRQDMFEVLKATVLLQKVSTLDPIVLQPGDALRMACRGGARAMGLEDRIGVVEQGRKADLITVDLQSPFVAPVHRIESALVFCCTPRDIQHVIVNGRVLVRDGVMTTIDEASVVASAIDKAGELFRRAGVSSRLSTP